MPKPTEITESGRRASDIVNTHIAAVGMKTAVNKWVAIRLTDGGSDNVLYDDRESAVRHQLHEMQCAYVCIPPGGSNPEDMTRFLAIARTLYDRGLRLSDPRNDPTGVIMRGVN